MGATFDHVALHEPLPLYAATANEDRDMANSVFDHDEADWRAAVETALKGASFDVLRSKTADGIDIEPLYPRGSEAPIFGRAPARPWQALSRCDHPDPGAANALALDDLKGGAAGLSLLPRGAPTAHGFGLDLSRPNALATLLDGVRCDWIAIRLEPSPGGRRAAEKLRDHLVGSGADPAGLDVSFGLDPIGNLAARGDLAAEWTIVAGRLAETAKEIAGDGFAGPLMEADGRPWHAAGATEAQELAAVLATALAYLRAVEDNGLDLQGMAGRIGVSLAADADQFATVAKLRAMRKLWASLMAHCGLEPARLRIHAETAWRMLTRRDPHVNTLRATVAAFSAGVGGADSIAVLPFTQALGLADGFARRIARNLQTILIEESNLYRVADPAAGAGALQTLTDALAEEAWNRFRDIEKQGGIVAALRAGTLQQAVVDAAAQRQAGFASRKRLITGTSAFANLAEAVPETLGIEPKWSKPKADAAIRIEPLTPRRDADAFEVLRDRADGVEAARGTPPTVFLAALGPAAQSTTRASWARSFFEAGGIRAVAPSGDTTPETLAKAFAESGADLACLASSDAVYEETGRAAAEALKAAGAKTLFLAGRPDAGGQDWEAAGVTGHVFQGCAAVAILEGIYDTLALERAKR